MSKETVKAHVTGRSKLNRSSRRQYGCRRLGARSDQPQRGVNGGIVLDDAREVEDIASSARVDVERDGQTVLGIAVEHGRRVAGQRVTGEFLEALLEALGRQSGQVFEDGVHGSAASTRRAGLSRELTEPAVLEPGPQRDSRRREMAVDEHAVARPHLAKDVRRREVRGS